MIFSVLVSASAVETNGAPTIGARPAAPARVPLRLRNARRVIVWPGLLPPFLIVALLSCSALASLSRRGRVLENARQTHRGGRRRVGDAEYERPRRLLRSVLGKDLVMRRAEEVE